MSEEGIKIYAKMSSKDDVSMFMSGLRKKWTRDPTDKSKLKMANYLDTHQ